MALPPFHLAIPVDDLAKARAFYGGLLGCLEGRSAERWVDFDFYGHQLVCHLVVRPKRINPSVWEKRTTKLLNLWCDFSNRWEPSVGIAPLAPSLGAVGRNPVDGDAVPVPHFGVVLEWRAFHALADRLAAANTAFVIAPRIRFAGKVGEQATFFLHDPAGNALEFKAFRNPERLFAREPVATAP
ncbi:MAG: VOC family protein [Pseudomonadota bacterium]